MGVAALVVLILGKKFLPRIPVALVVVIAGLLVGANFDLAGRGVKMLGEVPQGLPAFGIHGLERSDLNNLLPLAMACFLLGAVETAAIGRTFARKHGYRLDSNQDFLALAGANLAAGLGQGFPTSGGMSQSLVNESSGARTPLSGFIASLLILAGHPFSIRRAALPAPAGARRHRAGGHHRTLQLRRAQTHVECQPRASSPWLSPRC